MNIRFGPVAIAAILAEILGILSLVLLVVAFRPSDQTEVQAFAERLGFYVGPISGFLFCLAGGYWVARRASSSFLANGLATGVAAAVLDILIAAVAGAPFHWILIVSNAGRIIAGTIGGLLAKKRHG